MRYSGATYLSDGTVSGEEPSTSTHWHVIAVDGVYSAVAGSGIDISGNTISVANGSITVEMIASDLANVINGKEVKSNKKTTLTGNESSNDFYPTTKAVADALRTKAPASTAYTFNSTTTEVPFDVNNPKIIYLNAVVDGESGIVITSAHNAGFQLFFGRNGTSKIRLRNGADTYAEWQPAAEKIVNKKDAITNSNKTSTEFYPSIKALVDYLAANYEALSNKLTSAGGIDEGSTDTEYPTAKAVFNFGTDILDEVAGDLVLKENLSNKKNAIAGNETSGQYYPTTKAVYDYLVANYENLSNKLSSEAGIDENSTDNEYPTGKAVYNFSEVVTDVIYSDEDLSEYSSVSSTSGRNQACVVIAPNEVDPYFLKSAQVKTKAGTPVKFSVFGISKFYPQDPANRKRFTKVRDIVVINADDDGVARIEFDLPMRFIPDETALVASCDTSQSSFSCGPYKDAQHTIFNYTYSWFDLQPGESDSIPWEYRTSNNSPYFVLEYVLVSNTTEIKKSAAEILQEQEYFSPYDNFVSDTSENPVQNKVLYEELNITKTETIIPTDTTWKNSEAVQPQGYNGWFTVAYVDETDAVKLKKLDIFARTGASVKLGIWTYRPHAVGAVRGYLTLKSVLGTVTAADSHAVFNLDSVDFDPSTEFLGIAASSGAIGYNTGIVNGFVGEWFNTDNGFYNTAVGEENSLLMNAPGKTSSTSRTVQGNYTITYQLAESKTITTVTNVKNAVDDMIEDVEELKHSTPVVDSPLRTPHNKYFCILVDDLTRDVFNITDRLLSIGVKPAFGLKMESMVVDINWDEMKKLQDMGFEIAFHGMSHSHTPAGTAPANDAVMIADIAEFKSLCSEHGVILHGYLGPNHYPLPVGAFKEFEWARGPYGLKGYGAPSNLGTTFASVSVWSCDPLSASDMPTIKQTMISAASSVADNQYLTPMCHTQNLVTYIDDYMDVFEAWIAAGLEPMRPMDAVKQSLFNAGGIGNNSTFEIQAGTATNPYYLIAGNGTVLHNP